MYHLSFIKITHKYTQNDLRNNNQYRKDILPDANISKPETMRPRPCGSYIRFPVCIVLNIYCRKLG